jgi:YihY family inner membrane protein
MAEPNAARGNAPTEEKPRRDAVPDTPTDLERGSWLAAGKRSVREFKDDFLQDRAAALTYYSIQSIFPALLVLVSLLGLIGKSATQPLITNLAAAAPSSVRQIILGAVTRLQQQHATAGLLAIVAILVGLWSASGYVAAFMRASNAIYDVPEGRPIWKTMPIRYCTTLVLVVLLAASGLIVVVTGGVARHVGQVLDVGSAAITAWDIAKWPVLLIIFSLMLAILYWASPNAKHGFRWVSPGGIVAIVLWLIASGLFALYVANFGHYNKIYGSIAGVIIFMIWTWLSNVAILLGAEFNAELERGRAIAGGAPPDQEPFVELRDTRKLRT